jgi:hypothetical protein
MTPVMDKKAPDSIRNNEKDEYQAFMLAYVLQHLR